MIEQFETHLARIKELEQQGLSHARASGLAALEQRIEVWPSPTTTFDGYLYPVLYGDFLPPERDVAIPAIGLTVYRTPLKGSLPEILYVRAPCILQARISVDAQTVGAIENAAERLDLFAGAWVLAQWGNSAVRWWSYVTHGDATSASMNLDKVEVVPIIERMQNIPNATLRKRIRAALFWAQEPQKSITDAPIDQSLRRFMAYWTALECLITGILDVYPMEKQKAEDKQSAIDALFAGWQINDGKLATLSPQQVESLWRIVDRGLKARAQHAFGVLFANAEQVNRFMYECFERPDQSNRLYQVRNDIAHGNISHSDPLERHRVEARETDLWIILWTTFGRLLPVSVPHPKALSSTKHLK